MNTDRIKEIQSKTAYPDSISVQQALLQVWNECEQQQCAIHDVSGTLSDQTKRHIDFAYLTGVFNVSGIDGLQKELTRLKEIGKNPHDIFSEGNYH